MEAGMKLHAMIGSVGIGRTQDEWVLEESRDLSDGQIIDAVKQGDRDAFRGIVDRHKYRAYRVALSLVGDRQDALDVSQAAFIKAYRNLKRFDTRRPFVPWFYSILRNLCLDHLRRSKRRREVPLADTLIIRDVSMDTETAGGLRRAVDALPAEQREAVVLHYFEGLSYKEIASVMDKPVGTVMSSLYYARQKLKQALKGTRSESKRGD
jgi:RNA polymerase sigma-70 factor (ECF subfamily)